MAIRPIPMGGGGFNNGDDDLRERSFVNVNSARSAPSYTPSNAAKGEGRSGHFSPQDANKFLEQVAPHTLARHLPSDIEKMQKLSDDAARLNNDGRAADENKSQEMPQNMSAADRDLLAYQQGKLEALQVEGIIADKAAIFMEAKTERDEQFMRRGFEDTIEVIAAERGQIDMPDWAAKIQQEQAAAAKASEDAMLKDRVQGLMAEHRKGGAQSASNDSQNATSKFDLNKATEKFEAGQQNREDAKAMRGDSQKTVVERLREKGEGATITDKAKGITLRLDGDDLVQTKGDGSEQRTNAQAVHEKLVELQESKRDAMQK